MNGLYRGDGTGKQACRNDGKTVLLLRVQEYGLIELYILFQASFSCVFWLLQSAGTGKRQKTIMQSMTVKRTGFCRACEKTGQECRGIRQGGQIAVPVQYIHVVPLSAGHSAMQLILSRFPALPLLIRTGKRNGS